MQILRFLKLVLITWPNRQRQRRQLIELDHHILRDLGIDEYAARAEAEKPFWR